MSVSNMLTAATLPISDPNSLFVDPSVAGRNELQTIKSVINSMYGASGEIDPIDPTFDTNIDMLCNNISTQMASKIASAPTQIPLMTAASQTDQRVATIDAQLANQPPPVVTNVCDDLMTAAFQTIKEVGTFIANLASSIYDMFATLLTPLFDTIGTIIGSVVSSVKDVFGALSGSFGGSVLSAISGSLSGLVGIISDIVSSVSGAISSFASMIAQETAVIASAIGRLLNFSFINSLNFPNPCVQTIHDTIINQNNVDSAALTALR